MQDTLTVYFDGEKYAGLLLAGIAVAVIIAATIMFRAGAGIRPFAVTLGVVALVALKARTAPAGIALGLLISASILLAFDVFAERRGAEYVAAITDGRPSD